MLFTIFLWVILGAVAGAVVAFALGTNEKMGYATNILVGIVGAVIGGLLLRIAGIELSFQLNGISLITAFIGAILLLALVRAVRDTSKQ